MMGLDNPIHIAFLLLVVLLVFGAKRLPEIGRSLGAGMRGFRDSISGENVPPAATTAQPQLPPRALSAHVAAAPALAPATTPVATPVAATVATPVGTAVAEPIQEPRPPTSPSSSPKARSRYG